MSVYAATILLLNIPAIQHRIAILTSHELSKLFNTEVNIGKVDIGVVNRIIIDNLTIADQKEDEMIKVARLSAKLEILPLFNGKIRISSVQLFGFNVSLNKENPSSPLNLQFIIDKLSSEKKEPSNKSLDLRINSILIRRGRVSYDVLSADTTPGSFNPNHIAIQNIIANISLKALQNDSLNMTVKRLSIEEASGFDLEKLSFKLTANKKRATIDGFTLELPKSSIQMDTIYFKYDSIADLKNLEDKVHISTQLNHSFVTLDDLSMFVPAFSKLTEQMNIDLQVDGTVNNFTCHHFSIASNNKNIAVQGKVDIKNLCIPQNEFIDGEVSLLTINQQAIGRIFENLNKPTPSVLQAIDYANFFGTIKGEFKNISAYGLVETNLGTIEANLHSALTQNDEQIYNGRIETESINLKQLLNDNKLGDCAFDLDIYIKQKAHYHPHINIEGFISSFEYNNYQYRNIQLNGDYNKKHFDGTFFINDPNVRLNIEANANFTSKTPEYKLTSQIINFNPNKLNLTDKHNNAIFSVKLDADFKGSNIDNLVGVIDIDSLYYTTPQKEIFMKNLNINSYHNDSEKYLSVNSDFLKASIKGDYQYKNIAKSFNKIISQYLPSLFREKRSNQKTNNNFFVDIQLLNTDLISEVFDIPLHIYTKSSIKAFIDDASKSVHLEGYFPRFKYKNNFIESAMFICSNNSDNISGKARLTKKNKDNAVNIAVNVEAFDDHLSTNIDWGNNSNTTYSGRLSTLARFFKEETSKEIKSTIHIQPTDVILNDTIWKIHPSEINIESKTIHINNFSFSHAERHLKVNGTISNNPADTIVADLKNINLGYVFDIAQVTDDVIFGGDATGIAYASDLLNNPKAEAHLNVRNFCLNHGPLGNLNITGIWNNENKGIYLDAHIKDKSQAESTVKGYIFPIKPTSGLDLHIDANNLNIKFIEFYMQSIAQELKGTATGKVRLYGKFKELTLDGAAYTDASMKFEFLNTGFLVKDTIRLQPKGLDFIDLDIYDFEGHTGNLNGYLRYDHFKDIQYRLDIQVNNMLLMNTHETPGMPFYGTVYGTGNASLSGNAQSGLMANVGMTTNRNTVFNYSIGTASTATSTQFIKFNDKSPRRIQDTLQIITDFNEVEMDEEATPPADIRLNLLIDATPDATMKIIMDPTTGDYISCKGNGNIRTDFYNKGDVKLFGNYTINQGIYKFSLQEVIRKDFIIQNGSSITFNGPPLDATLDINAYYTVTSASLNDLIPDASSMVQQPNVKVNCMMHLSGILLHPMVKLDIALPNERDEVQALVRNYISTEEQMNMQILYLLGIGKFYTENANGTRQSDMMSSVLSSTLSGQLNNLLSQIIDNNNWNIGTNLSTGEKGWTDVEVEGILSGQLLNNRLLINGNFGYKDNPMSNTNFVGDFEAEWLLNTSGDIRLKAYNESNDRYYTKTNLTTQGVGILFKKDFNHWAELNFFNKWRLKNLQKKLKLKSSDNEPSYVTPTDSVKNESFIIVNDSIK